MDQSTTTMNTQQPDPLEQQAVTLTRIDLPAVITSAEQYERIAGELKALVGWIKAWDEHHDPIIQAAHRTHDLACKAKNKYGNPAKQLKVTMARLLGEYSAEQQRIANEAAAAEQRRLDKIERDRVAAEALQATQRANEAALESKRLSDDADAARELAGEADDDATRFELVAEADHLERVADDRQMESQYDRQAAQDIAAAPPPPTYIAPRNTAPTVQGVAPTKRWEAWVRDPKMYLLSLLENYDRNEMLIKEMIEAVMPALNREATNVKKEIEIAPGVWARPKHSASVRA